MDAITEFQRIKKIDIFSYDFEIRYTKYLNCFTMYLLQIYVYCVMCIRNLRGNYTKLNETKNYRIQEEAYAELIIGSDRNYCLRHDLFQLFITNHVTWKR